MRTQRRYLGEQAGERAHDILEDMPWWSVRATIARGASRWSARRMWTRGQKLRLAGRAGEVTVRH